MTHFIEDYKRGPEWSRLGHYEDWVTNAEGLEGQVGLDRINELMSKRANIHFHVWDFDFMRTFFGYAASLPEINLSIVYATQNRGEGVWILEKQ